MNRFSLPILGSLAMLLLHGPAVWADEDPRLIPLKRLGQLNGTALACRRFDQSTRIKRILIDHLPKKRELGQIFEETTNESFLQFVKSASPCPSPATLEQAVDKAEAALIQAWDSQADRP